MLISVEIKDSKAKPFLEFLSSLDFVKIEPSELNEEDHIKLLNERLAEYESNPNDSENLKDVLPELKNKYGL